MLQCSLGGPRVVVVGLVGAAAASSHRKNALHLSRPDVPPAVAKHRGDRCLAFALHSPTCPTCPKLPPCCSPRELDGGRAQEKSKVSAARYEVTGSRPIRRREILGRPMGGPGLPAERPDVKRRGRRSSTGSPVVPQ